MCKLTLALLTAAALLPFAPLRAQTDKEGAANTPPVKSEPEKAWDQLQEASKPTPVPGWWQTNRPSQEEVGKFRTKQGEAFMNAAAMAKDFQARFPEHPKIAEAKEQEHRLLQSAARLGNTDAEAELAKIETEKLKDPTLTEDERFRLKAEAVQRRAQAKVPQGPDAALTEFENGARELQKEFPKRNETWEMLLSVASEHNDGTKSIKLAREISESAAPDNVKRAAQGILKELGRIGQPLEIKFTAVDGREVNLQDLKGKVVLVDFWATWCGPCVKELPSVKAAYEKLQPKGFEIVGISLDNSKDALKNFVEKQKMTWPQFADGKGWQSVYATQFGIKSIPAMWLVDKKGVLRDMKAREGLTDKVEKLLAESM